eukprot:RCo025205
MDLGLTSTAPMITGSSLGRSPFKETLAEHTQGSQARLVQQQASATYSSTTDWIARSHNLLDDTACAGDESRVMRMESSALNRAERRRAQHEHNRTDADRKRDG